MGWDALNLFLANLLLPPANEIRGWGCAWQGVCMAGGHVWQGLCMAGACVVVGGGVHARGHAWQGVHMLPPSTDTTRYGQWAGGTHPTGMHSSFIWIFGGCKSLLWGHWYPCFGLLVMSPQGFKSRGRGIGVTCSLRFISGVTPADHLMASMVAQP